MTSALLSTYRRIDIEFESGDGAWLVCRSGERYLDFGTGVAVNSLGHRHPALVEALTRQADTLWHLSNNYRIPGGERLARRLADATFADAVFFTNSGAEAVECAIKMARRYHASRGEPGRYRIITFDGAFHGRTLATIAAGGQPKYLEGFGPKVDGFDSLLFGDWDAVEAAIGPATGAILIEPIQGEGGVRAMTCQDLERLRSICDRHGLLLILDEVQCGVGRTGRLFAHEWAEVKPDIMTIAKGIGGGFPMGACLASTEAASGMTAGSHGSTFGGNPLAMAVGNAVLDVILAPKFLPHVRQVAEQLLDGLEALAHRHPDVFKDVTGKGLMLGMRLKVPNADFISTARAQRLLVLSGGNNSIRILPPLTVTGQEIEVALQRLDAAASHTPLSARSA